MPAPKPAAPASPALATRVPRAPDVSPDDLSAAASALRGDLPRVKAAAASRPGGVNATYCWALKRLERWDAGDVRPVIVHRFADGRFVAEVVADDGVTRDGDIRDLQRHVHSSAKHEAMP